VQLVIAVVKGVSRLRRSPFRVFVFPNAAIERAITEAGLEPRYHKRGVTWVVALYERRPR
jgi:hypothetical protein